MLNLTTHKVILSLILFCAIPLAIGSLVPRRSVENSCTSTALSLSEQVYQQKERAVIFSEDDSCMWMAVADPVIRALYGSAVLKFASIYSNLDLETIAYGFGNVRKVISSDYFDRRSKMTANNICSVISDSLTSYPRYVIYFDRTNAILIECRRTSFDEDY